MIRAGGRVWMESGARVWMVAALAGLCVGCCWLVRCGAVCLVALVVLCCVALPSALVVLVVGVGWCWLSACCAGGAGRGFCMDGGRLLHGAWGDYRGAVNRLGIDLIPRA